MLAEPRSYAQRAVAAAEQAIVLDRECVPALAVRVFVATTIDGKIAVGFADLERAMHIAAGYWKARRLHGWALLADNPPLEAVAEVQAALELNSFGLPARRLAAPMGISYYSDCCSAGTSSAMGSDRHGRQRLRQRWHLGSAAKVRSWPAV